MYSYKFVNYLESWLIGAECTKFDDKNVLAVVVIPYVRPSGLSICVPTFCLSSTRTAGRVKSPIVGTISRDYFATFVGLV